MCSFADYRSCDRIVYAVFNKYNKQAEAVIGSLILRSRHFQLLFSNPEPLLDCVKNDLVLLLKYPLIEAVKNAHFDRFPHPCLETYLPGNLEDLIKALLQNLLKAVLHLAIDHFPHALFQGGDTSPIKAVFRD